MTGIVLDVVIYPGDTDAALVVLTENGFVIGVSCPVPVAVLMAAALSMGEAPVLIGADAIPDERVALS